MCNSERLCAGLSTALKKYDQYQGKDADVLIKSVERVLREQEVSRMRDAQDHEQDTSTLTNIQRQLSASLQQSHSLLTQSHQRVRDSSQRLAQTIYDLNLSGEQKERLKQANGELQFEVELLSNRTKTAEMALVASQQMAQNLEHTTHRLQTRATNIQRQRE